MLPMEPKILWDKGLRRITPYYFEYQTPFKERWSGRTVPQVLCRELGQTLSAVEKGIDEGQIYVTKNNGKQGSPIPVRGESARVHLLQPHDIIYNLQHTHEPPIWVPRACETSGLDPSNDKGDDAAGFSEEQKWEQLCSKVDACLAAISPVNFSSKGSEAHQVTSSGIQILCETDSIIVVNKPAGVPTHPGGIYRYNTVSEILAHDLGFPVWPCHRLDKSTSGVLLFAKTKAACKQYMGLFKGKSGIDKWYLARVKGNFPHGCWEYTCPVFSVNLAGAGYLNIKNARSVPADSTTVFSGVHYMEKHNQSLILCRPVSGRMHQIRIHLRNLGYPIANDTTYNGEGSNLQIAKNKIETTIYESLWTHHPEFRSLRSQPVRLGPHAAVASAASIGSDSGPVDCPTINALSLITPEIRSSMHFGAQIRAQQDISASSGTCPECDRPIYDTAPDSGIWLHAYALTSRAANESVQLRARTDVPAWSSA